LDGSDDTFLAVAMASSALTMTVVEERRYPLVYPPPVAPIKTKKVKPWRPKGKFRFLDLPSEIRDRIYEHVFLEPHTVDLSPENRKNLAPRLELLQVSRQIYNEAYPVFYGRNTFRVFPTHDQCFHTKWVLLTRLPRRYRKAITSMELRLGPGWTKPPKSWNTGAQLGLKDCTSLRRLKIFIEIDPSHDIFKGYRVDDRFYTLFCAHLIEGILEQVPSLESIDFEAYSFVSKDSTLLQELVSLADAEGKRIRYIGAWKDCDEVHDVDASLETAVARLRL